MLAKGLILVLSIIKLLSLEISLSFFTWKREMKIIVATMLYNTDFSIVAYLGTKLKS